MGKNKRNHSVQKNTTMIDAACTCPYELASIQLNTDKVAKIKRKTKSTHICKCVDDVNVINSPNTWNSSKKIYEDADTTEIWDNKENKAKMFLSSLDDKNIIERPNNLILKMYEDADTTDMRDKNKNKAKSTHVCKCDDDNKKINRPTTWNSITQIYGDSYTTIKKRNKANLKKTKSKNKIRHEIIQETENNGTNIIKPKLNKKINKRNTLINKKSIISLYRKPMKNKKISVSKNLKDKEVPLRFLNITREGTGDACIGGPCREGKEYRHPQIGNKQVVVEDKNLKSTYVGYGDQTAQITSKQKRKFGLLKNIFSHTCKCDIEKEQTLHVESKVQEPYIEMKVDSLNMCVLNSDEIKEKVRQYGGKGSCICPSRLARLNGTQRICRKGVCQKAQMGKTKFDCKCLKNDVIECNELTCNMKGKLDHRSNKNKPLLNVMIDSNDMSIINTNEVKDIIGKKSNNQVCPNGVCNFAGQDRDNQYICKCTNKKLKLPECTDETCIKPETKFKLLYLCSRIFCKSENWSYQINNVARKRRKRSTYMTVADKDNMKAKSDINKRNGLSINISRGIHKKPRVKKEDTLPMSLNNVGCVCECDQFNRFQELKKSSIEKDFQKEKGKNQEKKNKGGKGKKQTKKTKKRVRERQKLQFRHKNITFKERLLDCLKTKRTRCERRLKEEEKAFESYEKKALKENRKIKKEQEDNKHIDDVRWNCITKFLAGVLNLTFESTKNIIITAVTLITNPIGSYVYIRERSKNASATLMRLVGWFNRTWGNRSSKISKPLQDVTALNVIADQIEDSVVFSTLFASKGRTRAERALYDRKIRYRKRRMKRRYDEALYGCQNVLLTTMRKTPCIWCYYICPNMYPQCLSLVNFMKNFCNVLIFLGAFLCWTPCILTFELCRAFMCCFLCTN